MITFFLWFALDGSAETPAAEQRNPHAELRQLPVPDQACAACHSGPATAEDPALHVPPPRVCFSCHPDHQHVGIPSHLDQVLPAAMAARAADAGLPVWEGKVACVTCHDPHPHPANEVPSASPVPAAFAAATHRLAPVESDLLRLPLTSSALCVACHDPEHP